ncbi:CPBP family intramembrane glutamic endopeptidase [Algihabitans albus]|uniref:CPBP family intramembrane glutamic endopeptidase n=1 Tax=Algihabitans albus TaxID=2164067 RepID=UPI001ABCD0BE|nr:type II CAAX endopeptidase family protein [Algihabitans albus]
MPKPQRPAARPDLIDVLVTVACFLGAGYLVIVVAGALGLASAGGRASAVLVPLVLASQAAVFLAVFMVVLWHGRGLSLRLLGLGPMPPGWLKRGILWGVGAVLPAIAVNAVTFVLFGVDQTNPQVEMLAPAGPSLWGFLLVLPLVSILVPFVEEVAFRGVLYGWLRHHLKPGLAMAVSAAVFSVAHGIPQLIPALLLVGLLLARLRELEDSLWPCVAMHGAFNAVMTMIMFAALSVGADSMGTDPTQAL